MDAAQEQGGGKDEFAADFVKEENEGAYDVDPKEAEDDGSAGAG
jgi:hypothetical protein